MQAAGLRRRGDFPSPLVRGFGRELGWMDPRTRVPLVSLRPGRGLLSSLDQKGDTAIRVTQVPVTVIHVARHYSAQCPATTSFLDPVSRALGPGYHSNSAPRSLQRNPAWCAGEVRDGKTSPQGGGSAGWFLHWRLQSGINQLGLVKRRVPLGTWQDQVNSSDSPGPGDFSEEVAGPASACENECVLMSSRSFGVASELRRR